MLDEKQGKNERKTYPGNETKGIGGSRGPRDDDDDQAKPPPGNDAKGVEGVSERERTGGRRRTGKRRNDKRTTKARFINRLSRTRSRASASSESSPPPRGATPKILSYTAGTPLFFPHQNVGKILGSLFTFCTQISMPRKLWQNHIFLCC
jgi:hypothetical protein